MQFPFKKILKEIAEKIKVEPILSQEEIQAAQEAAKKAQIEAAADEAEKSMYN